MKSIVLVVLALAVLAQADRDLSKFTPKHITVRPKRPAPIPRIVGGQEANRHQFPHQCALFIDGGSFCGCSVIDSKTILTAAHCVDGARSVEVVCGAHNIRQEESTQQVRKSSDLKVHEGWDSWQIINDVALIHLSEPLELNDQVQPIDLYGGSDTLDGQQATVSGWGRPSDSSSGISDVLRHVSNDIISNKVCESYYGSLPESVVCLNGQGGRGSCNGDSGGPLIHDNLDGGKKEVGVVSFGSAFGCAIGYPSAYSRVSHFLSWINQNRKA
ncbi:hypothetical protein ILUMI_10546 [Ignelater luminosus]|uniref:Peptidase S1 domain-containing protein n=1 Tax=Ignelater luminosus TaxID=2038154 RepID=A0A8K0GE27_IGNLU|nr:hypothetical protein ILUMI_10546 [Ignelater luminosus]